MGPEPSGVQLSVSDNGIGIPDGLDLEHADTLGLQLVSLLSDQISARLDDHITKPFEPNEFLSKVVKWTR